MGIGAAIAGAIGAAAGWGAATIQVVGIAISSALTIGANVLVQKLQGRPDAQSRPGRSGNVRSASMAHQVIYGESRKGGLIAYANGSGAKGNNKWLYMVVIFAAHKVESFGDFYINGELVTIDPVTGNTGGRFDNYASFQFMDGDPAQEANADLIERVGDADNWGPNHRLQG